jgi:hypothetical protein
LGIAPWEFRAASSRETKSVLLGKPQLTVTALFWHKEFVKPQSSCPKTFPFPWRRKMSPEEREQMSDLCARIEKEQNNDEFIKLARELNALLEKSALAEKEKKTPG